MKVRNLVLSVLSVFAIGSQAHADLLLEPYLGYHIAGKHQYGGAAGDDSIGGVTLGARVAYQRLGLFVGGDYMTGMWKLDASPTVDTTPSDLGVVVGYEFPVLLRVYGVYNFQSTNTVKNSGAADSKLEGGSGFKLGVGTTMFPFIAVGLEYRSITYTKLNGAKLTNNQKDDTYGLSVSLPFVL